MFSFFLEGNAGLLTARGSAARFVHLRSPVRPVYDLRSHPVTRLIVGYAATPFEGESNSLVEKSDSAAYPPLFAGDGRRVC